MEIVGTGFQSGAVVVFDDVRVQGRFDPRFPGTIYLETPAHAEGPIDITVTNPDGQSALYPRAITFARPETFDPNGDWIGVVYGVDGSALGFTIQSGKLVRAYCHVPTSFTELPLAEPISVVGGTFSASEFMSGRIVSAREIVGTMNFGGCSHMSFRAGRRPTTSLHR